LANYQQFKSVYIQLHAKICGECKKNVNDSKCLLTHYFPQTFAVTFAPNMLYNRSELVGMFSMDLANVKTICLITFHVD